MEASTNGLIIRRPSSDGGGGWDHQITGLDRYRGNVYVSFRIKELDSGANHTMFGFSTDPNSTAHYNNINFAWYIDNGSMTIYEAGVSEGVNGTYDEESVYTIARVGSTVSYYQDGVLQRSVSGITTADLYLDSSFHSSIELRDIKVGVTYVAETGVVQFVSKNISSTWNTTSGSYISTDLTIDFTPKYADSNILVQFFGSTHFSSTSAHGYGQIRKNGATISNYSHDDLLAYSSISHSRGTLEGGFWSGPAGSTATATYAYYVRTNTGLFYFYRNHGISIMEIRS
jgi:hypothetical protein